MSAQVPYWIALLTPEERPFGPRRTDPFIDTVDCSVTTTTLTQWTGATHPAQETLLAVLAATVGAWQSDRCRNTASGVLVDIEDTDGSYFPVRLPSVGSPSDLAAEVQRRIAATPGGGVDYVLARNAPVLSRRAGAQIAFGELPTETDESLLHSLVVACEVSEIDGVAFVETSFAWNSRVFSCADVDDFERFWEKTISTFA